MNKLRKKSQHRFRGGKQLSSAKDILERTLSVRHLEKKLKRFSLFVDWSEIVGDSVAQVAHPKKLVRGTTLLVEVVDPVWVQELALQKQGLLKTINDSCDGILIDDIQFVSGNPQQF